MVLKWYKNLSHADTIRGDDFLKNTKDPENSVLSSHNTEYSRKCADDINALQYIGFASNGTTDNERIDDFDYYYDFLDRKGEQP